jgi:hypothetical protein
MPGVADAVPGTVSPKIAARINCAIRDGDAHLKNFGIIYKDAESPARLAPVYDLMAYIKNDVVCIRP